MVEQLDSRPDPVQGSVEILRAALLVNTFSDFRN
jgi:hypothetical protein